MIQFKLDRKSQVPFYRQIVDIVLSGLAAGALLPGEQLPTLRDLAVKLGINPNTVVKAYSQLQLLGVLDTQQGSGVFVRPGSGRAVPKAERRRALEALCQDFVARAQLQNLGIDEIIEHLQRMTKGARRRETPR